MVKRQLENLIRRSIKTVFGAQVPKALYTRSAAPVTPSKLDTVDYQSSVCLKIAKCLTMSPIEVAERVVLHMKQDQIMHSVRVSPPGFINIRLADSFLVENLESTLRSLNQKGQGVKATNGSVLIDFSSPNIGKELHAGHMRSIFCGDTLANVFEFLGHQVDRVSHVGDFGLPVAVIAQYCWSNKQALQPLENRKDMATLKFIGNLYKQGNQKDGMSFKGITNISNFSPR